MLLQHGEEPVGARKLHGEGPAPDPVRHLQHALILIGAGVAEITRVLRAALGCREIRSLEMEAEDLRAAILDELHGIEEPDEIEERLLRARHARGQYRGGAMLEMRTAGAVDIIDGAIHEVISAGAMGMHIDEARAHIAPSRIDDLGIARRRGLPYRDIGNPAILDEDGAFPHAIWEHEASVYDRCLHAVPPQRHLTAPRKRSRNLLFHSSPPGQLPLLHTGGLMPLFTRMLMASTTMEFIT